MKWMIEDKHYVLHVKAGLEALIYVQGKKSNVLIYYGQRKLAGNEYFDKELDFLKKEAVKLLKKIVSFELEIWENLNDVVLQISDDIK